MSAKLFRALVARADTPPKSKVKFVHSLEELVRDNAWTELGKQMAQDYRDFLARPGVVRRMREAGLLGNGDKHEKTNEDSGR